MSIFILLCLIFTIRGDWYHNSKAFSITGPNLQSYIGLNQHIILDFFTPWCMYCQQMLGEYNKVYDHYNDGPNRRNDILISKINCDEEQNNQVCRGFGVNSFPTIMFIPKGQSRPTAVYQNYRTAQYFIQWIDSLAPMTAEIQQQQQEYEAEQIRIKQIEQDRLAQEQYELELEQQAQATMAQTIETRVNEIQQYIDKLSRMDVQIDEMNQVIAQLNTQMGLIKRQPKINVSHVMVFGTIGMLIGILFTSCVCMMQKSYQFADKL